MRGGVGTSLGARPQPLRGHYPCLTLQGGVTIGPQNVAANEGGGLYLGKGSTTTFNGCTISGNKAKTGVGYYEQNGATINPLILINNDGFQRGN